mmetsp:Transcript_14828/g.14239  ORF Transcript_14828/g.14239 Transcript_14828/m.14239 type:complete len:236 (+) Transcript_14828:428-1135(+)
MSFSSFKSLGNQVSIQNYLKIDLIGYQYNVIDTNKLFLYYPFDNNSQNGNSIANYATGEAVFDTTIKEGSNLNDDTFENNGENTGGLHINRVIPVWPNGLSFAFWINIKRIVTYGFFFTITDGRNRYFVCNERDTNRLRINNLVTSYAMPQNTWFHLCVTINPDGSSIYYIDNVPTSFNAGYPSYDNVSGLNAICIDVRGKGANAFMDEFRLYNRVITPDEVTTLFNTKYSGFLL